MAEPRSLNVKQVAEHGSIAGALSAVGDECRSMNWYRKEHCWLQARVRSLERQLRRRTIVLAGALALSALLGSFTVTSFYESGRPTTAPAVAPSSGRPSNSQAVMWGMERASQIEQSQEWAMGEEQIELIATFHYDAQRGEVHTDQLATTWRKAGGWAAIQPESSARGEVHGQGIGAVERDRSPVAQTVVSASFTQDGNVGTRLGERSHYTAKDFVNLRAAPNNSAEVLTVVAQGDLVLRTGRDLGWLQVEYGNGSAISIKGWVYGTYLRSVENSGQQPRP